MSCYGYKHDTKEHFFINHKLSLDYEVERHSPRIHRTARQLAI